MALSIAFNVYSFSFRGTEVAIFDYADFNERILKNKSFIVTPVRRKDPFDEEGILSKFLNRFSIFSYSSQEELDRWCKEKKIDGVYFLKYGTKIHNPYLELFTPSLIHCVYKTNDPHGLVYAAVSESVAKCSREGNDFAPDDPESKAVSIQFVPHMLSLPPSLPEDNLREKLKIPQDAIVFGRHGGTDTFFLPGIRETFQKILKEITEKKLNIYFLFMPRPICLEGIFHPNLISLEKTFSVEEKRRFIETCDAQIHAQILGETQGLSVLEFSFYNKPVITWSGGRCKQHLINLGEKAIIYKDLKEMEEILLNFSKEKYKNFSGSDIIERYLPERVMKEFDKIFLSPLKDHKGL